MPLEVFTKRMAAAEGQPQVTIQRSGRTISFNDAALTALGKPEAVELLYDREDRIMGLRAVSRDIPHAYLVLHNTRKTTHMVAGGLFTRYYGISTDVARRWPAKMNGDVLCVDLKKPGTELVTKSPVRDPPARIPGVKKRS